MQAEPSIRTSKAARITAIFGVLGLLLSSPTVSMAQPAVAQAQSLFDQARTLLDQGKVEQACVAYEASQKLDPTVSTLLNLAACRERNQQLATAWGYFVQAKRLASERGDAKLQAVASRHADRLRTRVSYLTVIVPESQRVPKLVVSRGAESLDPSTWGFALPLDGGTYALSAAANGRVVWSASITLAPSSDAKVIEVGKTEESAASIQPAKPAAVERADEAKPAATGASKEPSLEPPAPPLELPAPPKTPAQAPRAQPAKEQVTKELTAKDSPPKPLGPAPSESPAVSPGTAAVVIKDPYRESSPVRGASGVSVGAGAASSSERNEASSILIRCEALAAKEDWGELERCATPFAGPAATAAARARAAELLALAAAEKRNKQEYDQFFAAQHRGDLETMQAISRRVSSSSVYASRITDGVAAAVQDVVTDKRRTAELLVKAGRCIELRALGLELRAYDASIADELLQMVCTYKAPTLPCADAAAIDDEILRARQNYVRRPVEVATQSENLLRAGGACVSPIEGASRQRFTVLTYLGLLAACRASLRPEIDFFVLLAADVDLPIPQICHDLLSRGDRPEI